MTAQSHRFAVEDYGLILGIRSDRTLREVFDDLVAEDAADPGDKERFYHFVLSLHRLRLLALPIADDELLYRRYEQKKTGRRAARPARE